MEDLEYKTDNNEKNYIECVKGVCCKISDKKRKNSNSEEICLCKDQNNLKMTYKMNERYMTNEIDDINEEGKKDYSDTFKFLISYYESDKTLPMDENCNEISKLDTSDKDYIYYCKNNECCIISIKDEKGKCQKCIPEYNPKTIHSEALKNREVKYDNTNLTNIFLMENCKTMLTDNQLPIYNIYSTEYPYQISNNDTYYKFITLLPDKGSEKTNQNITNSNNNNFKALNESSIKDSIKTIKVRYNSSNSDGFGENNSFIKTNKLNHTLRIPKSSLYSSMNFHIYNSIFIFIVLLNYYRILSGNTRSVTSILKCCLLYFIFAIILNVGNIF